MWPLSVFAKSSVRKLLQTYTSGGKAEPFSDIAALIDAKHTLEEINAHPLNECPAFAGTDTDAEHLKGWLNEAAELREAIDPLAPAIAEPHIWDISSQKTRGSV